MSVVIETTLGDITVDLFLQQRPVTCLNFLKLCKMKYYNFNLFHSIRSGFIAQTGDPTGEGTNGESIFGVLEGREKRFFSGEKLPKIRHTNTGTLSMVCTDDMMVGSQFFFTLAPDLDSLDSMHCVIGEVTEGHDVLRKLNDVICDEKHRPYRDVRITHTVILEDPFNDPPGFHTPSRSPSPSTERLKGGRIAPDEDIDEAQGKSAAEIQEMIEEKEAKARATILEIVGDLPDAEIAPPENVLFVCKLNPVTTDEDLEIIFSRFGTIVGCEVIRDKKTGDSLQYAFVEFSDKKSCEEAYFKMDNVLIDDRRIHVDFSQSVSKMRYLGKGRGVQYFNDDNDSSFQGKSEKVINQNNNGDYKNGKTDKTKDSDKHDDRDKYKRSRSRDRDRKKSRRERSRSKRERSRTRRERSRSRRYRSRSRSKRTSKSSRHRKRSSSRSRTARSRDRRRDRKSSPKKSRSDRKSSRDRRLRSPSPYSRRSRSRMDRSRDSKRDRKDTSKKSKRDKSYDRKKDKSTSRSRSNSRTHSRKSNDNKDKIKTKPLPEKSLESSTDDITVSASAKNEIIPRSRSNSQNKSNLNDQQEIIINNYPTETIKTQEENTPLVIGMVTKDRKSDLKANYNTYWRKSLQDQITDYPQEQINYSVLNTSNISTTSLIDKSKEKTEKHKVSRWGEPQEINLQDDQTINQMEIGQATAFEREEGSVLLINQNKEMNETSNVSQKNNSQLEQTTDEEEKSETSKWKSLQDATTLEHTDKVQSKSISKSPIETVMGHIEDIKVKDKESQLEIKQPAIMQTNDNNTARSRSKSPRPEQQPKTLTEKNTSESKAERIRKTSSNSNHNNKDDIKILIKPNSDQLDESSQNDRDRSRSRSKSHDNTVTLRREKSLEPTPEIEPKKLSKTDDSNKKGEDKKSHKLKKLKHHKEVSQKSEKKHKKSKEALITKKKHKTSKTKKNKKISKKRKRKHSTTSSSESDSDSSSSIETSSSSEDDRKKRSVRKRKKKRSTSSSSESSSSSSTSSSTTTSSSSSDSEPSKKKRKKVISSKASKKGKKKQ